jgi:nucleoside-diphosphate-sugar epimerase
VIVTNPVLVVGPGCIGEGSGALVTQAKKKFPFYTSGSTGFVDVRDVVRAMYLIEEKEIYNQRFILCGENLSFLNAFSFFNTAFSHRPPGFLIPKLVLWILSRIESFLHLFFSFKRRLTKSAIRSACSEKRYSSEKFLSQVDFNFTGIEKSIVDTCQFYKDFQKLS